MKAKLSLCILIIVCALPSNGDSAPELNLRDIIQEALDNNPGLQAAKHEALGQEAKISPSGSYDDPMIEFEAMNYPVDTLSAREFGMTGIQVSLAQKIPFPGKLTQLKHAATQDYQAQKEIYSARQLKLIKDVKIAYYDLYFAEHQKTILLDRKNVTHQLTVVTKNKYAVGQAQQAELLSLQAEEANVMAQLLRADRDISAKGADLSYLLGRKNTEYPGHVSALEATPISFSKLTEDLVAEHALKNNPQLKTAAFDRDAADARVSYAKWNYFPDFEFKIGYTLRRPNDDDRGVNLLSGAVAVSLPIWALSKQSEEVRAASMDQVKVEAMLTEQRLELLRSVHTLYAEIIESHHRMQLYESGLLPLARQTVVTGRSAYVAGKLEYASLLAFINNRYQTELDYNETLVNYQSRLAELEALLGQSIGELQ